jgi:hypothetical protein
MKGEEIYEDHKREGEMISGKKEQAKGPNLLLAAPKISCNILEAKIECMP